jgi:PBP1b-binding outer membrane lipoprotein LpoB
MLIKYTLITLFVLISAFMFSACSSSQTSVVPSQEPSLAPSSEDELLQSVETSPEPLDPYFQQIEDSLK